MSFTERVVGAASQGAAASVVAAGLSAVTEPIVNRVLVKRMSLVDAIQQVDVQTVQRFFNTTITTNFIKFPFFEVVSMLLANADVPAKGAVLGAVFTTATLPITNYRYCKSVNLPVDINALYKAYLPTVARDIAYGTARNAVSAAILSRYPKLASTPSGRFILMFCTVFASCVISAPGNELRGYFLQPKDRRLPVNEFFKPEQFIRSTAIGAFIMSTALGVGTLVTGPVSDVINRLKTYLNTNPIAKVLIAIFLVHEYTSRKRHSEVLGALQARKTQHDSDNKPTKL